MDPLFTSGFNLRSPAHTYQSRQDAAEQTKAKEAEIRRRGIEDMKREAADAAGFGTDVAAYEAAVAKEAEEQRHAELRDKFAEVKARLVVNGTRLPNGKLPEGKLLIVRDGRLYVISDEDEFALLSCAASTLA